MFENPVPGRMNTTNSNSLLLGRIPYNSVLGEGANTSGFPSVGVVGGHDVLLLHLIVTLGLLRRTSSPTYGRLAPLASFVPIPCCLSWNPDV